MVVGEEEDGVVVVVVDVGMEVVVVVVVGVDNVILVVGDNDGARDGV
jgi:hypothetical protein